MLQIQGISKSFGSQNLFHNVNFSLESGEKAGLLGKNGTGKTTLLKMIMGQEAPDEGSILYPRNYCCGYLSQHFSFSESTALQEAALGLPLIDRYAHHEVEQVLEGLGFSKEQMEQNPTSLSSGFQLRVELAKLLVSKPQMLLLDEPTNFLDLPSIRWLESMLREWKGEILMISHDRSFLDSVCNSMIMLHRGEAYRQQGNTEAIYQFVAQQEELHERTRVNIEKKKAHLQKFVDRFGAKATKAAQAQARIKAINKLPSLEKLSAQGDWAFRFPYSLFRGKRMLSVKNLTFGFKEDSLIKAFSFELFKGEKVAIIGKNGKGKSTLLRLLCGDLTPQTGDRHLSEEVRLSLFLQEMRSSLSERATIVEAIAEANPSLDETEVRQICGLMLFSGALADKPIHVLSGGEKSRVLLGQAIARPANLVMLDEPTNHLDLDSVESLIEAIEEYPGTLVLVSHNEHVLKSISFDRLLIFTENGIISFEGDFERFLLMHPDFFEEQKPCKEAKPKKKVIDREQIKQLRQEIRSIEKEASTSEIKREKLEEKRLSCLYNQDIEGSQAVTQEIDELENHLNLLYEQLETAEQKLQGVEQRG